MARLPRFVIPGQPQHVIVRGNNREAIFYADADYQFYLDKLKLACDKHGCDLHAYVLMTNHVHLLITPQKEESLAKALQMIGRYYVQYFNFTYQRTGTLFERSMGSDSIDFQGVVGNTLQAAGTPTVAGLTAGAAVEGAFIGTAEKLASPEAPPPPPRPDELKNR
ncbi:MAG: transposase [Marinagarivorans sp.]|nr:transposase [Marinagarivorans sp.]